MNEIQATATGVAEKSQATVLHPIDDARAIGNERFRRAAKRFISNADDARGQIALALFLYEGIDRDRNATAESLCEAIESVAPSTVSIVYLAAANRLLDNHFETLARKKIDAEISRDRLYLLLSQHADLRAENLASQIETGISQITSEVRGFAHTQTFLRQIGTSAVATVLVAAAAVTIAFSPDIVGVLRKLFGAS